MRTRIEELGTIIATLRRLVAHIAHTPLSAQGPFFHGLKHSLDLVQRVRRQYFNRLAKRNAQCARARWHGFGPRWGRYGGDVASLRNHRASTADPAILAGELSGLLAAETAAVNGKKVLISKYSGAAPTLAGGWETTVVAAIGGAGHA